MNIVEQVKACAEEGLTVSETARRLGRGVSTISSHAKRHGITFCRDPRGRPAGQGVGPHDPERIKVMATLYREGQTLQQIGDRFGISRERVRQIITKYEGITAKDGGRHVNVVRKAARARARKDARFLKQYGCTFAQWRGVIEIGRRMSVEGGGPCQTPLGAYRTQKRNALRRGIGWHLTFWEWWTVWHRSGKWDNRGRHKGGYVMCRVEDSGPYALGNVFISTSSENIKAIYVEDRSHESRLALATAARVAA